MIDALYQETIIEEYKYPKNKGEIDDANLVLDGRNVSCGDGVVIYLKLKHPTLKDKPTISSLSQLPPETKIVDLKWQGQGCAVSQAAMSVLSQEIKRRNLTVGDILTFQKSDLLKLLGLTEINQSREKCLLMGLSTLQK